MEEGDDLARLIEGFSRTPIVLVDGDGVRADEAALLLDDDGFSRLEAKILQGCAPSFASNVKITQYRDSMLSDLQNSEGLFLLVLYAVNTKVDDA